MGMLSRIRSDILIKVLIGIVIAILVGIVPNYQIFIYNKLEPLTAQDVKDQSIKYSIGYMPAGDISNATSAEEIRNSAYCTIAVKGKNLHPTGYYKILDETQAGVKKGTGRKAVDVNNYKYKSNGFSIWFMNNAGPQYGQFYVAELDNGDKIIVLLDQTVLSHSKSKTIQLPIGTVKDQYPTNFFESISSKYDLTETGTWYVDMAGSNFINSTHTESLVIIRFALAAAAFILTYLILTLIFKKAMS